MKLKDLIKNEIYCYFEIEGVKFMYRGVIYDYSKKYKHCFLERNPIGFKEYEELRDKEVKIVKIFPSVI